VFSGLTTKAVVLTDPAVEGAMFSNNVLVDVDSDHDRIEKFWENNIWNRPKAKP
jgi:hypothetical protein